MAISDCVTSDISAEGQELLKHGTTGFPVACYDDHLGIQAVPWHWHEELEAGVVMEGQAILAIGSKKFNLTEGSGFFVNTGVLHALWNDGTPDCRVHSLVFHPRVVGGSVDSVFWQRYMQPLLMDASLEGICFHAAAAWHTSAKDSIVAAWQACAREAEGYEFAARDALSQLVLALHRQHATASPMPSEKTRREGARIKLMLQYVQTHYGEEMTTADIAKSALVSVSECLRCFHDTIGTTPMQYVQWFRMEKAAELLATTDRKIADIGAQCGFMEMSYFAKAFRARRGVTPSEYRRQSALQ